MFTKVTFLFAESMTSLMQRQGSADIHARIMELGHTLWRIKTEIANEKWRDANPWHIFDRYDEDDAKNDAYQELTRRLSSANEIIIQVRPHYSLEDNACVDVLDQEGFLLNLSISFRSYEIKSR